MADLGPKPSTLLPDIVHYSCKELLSKFDEFRRNKPSVSGIRRSKNKKRKGSKKKETWF